MGRESSARRHLLPHFNESVGGTYVKGDIVFLTLITYCIYPEEKVSEDRESE
jgi:hypothetical protein